MLRNHGAGCNDGAFSDAGVVQHRGAHADDNHVFNRAAMDRCVVADGDPVADDHRVEIPLAMQHRTVLHIRTSAHADRVYVSAQHSIHPD